MTSAQLGDLQIEYLIDGPDDGEPLLLVMGMSAQLVAWPEDFVQLLVDHGFKVIRFDNRDQGLSSRTPGAPPTNADTVRGLLGRRWATADYTLIDLAEDAAQLLDHLGIESAHVAGVSMGGMIAQELTLSFPHKVRSLTSIMSNPGDRRTGRISSRLLPALVRQLRRPAPQTRDEAIDLGVDAYRIIAGSDFDADETRLISQAHVERGGVSAASRIRQLGAINASPDRTARLGSVTVPTLVIHGLSDRLVMPSGGIATARAVPGSRLLMFPEMGHDLPRGRRAEIAAAIATNAARARGLASTRS